MIKTSTKKNSSIQSPEGTTGTAKKESQFYDAIRPKLNQLIKNPSVETIESILSYSKKH